MTIGKMLILITLLGQSLETEKEVGMDKTLRFADSDEWVRDNGDGTVTVGISDHFQEFLGDVVFVDLPNVNDGVDAGMGFSQIESVRVAREVYSPITGEIVEINEDLEDAPELINEEPYEGGWIAIIKISDRSELDDLKSADEYLNHIEETSLASENQRLKRANLALRKALESMMD